ncbi:CDP-glycerol glycerophosphotransferase family protein [Streptomyces rubiginosohelvolus]|uniref:CDP-glycerol glycerophosphotransferase family protein n=1 Tax=Streptomyces rubiginosohelvolus TaxID=67362 RepID=UPI0033A2A589
MPFGGLYFDFERSAPGPLLFESAQLITAIRNVDRIQAEYGERYRWFQREFCDLDDGYAAARLTDRILIAGGDLDPARATAPAVGSVPPPARPVAQPRPQGTGAPAPHQVHTPTADAFRRPVEVVHV